MEISVLVCSKNPVKKKAVEKAMKKMHLKGTVESWDPGPVVRVQPLGEETFLGAERRVRKAIEEMEKKDKKKYDAYISIEGGIFSQYGRWFSHGAVFLSFRGKEAWALSPAFELPKHMVEKIKEGKELGEVIDELFSRKGEKRKGGAVGILTEGIITRANLYIPAVILAFKEVLNKEWGL